ncbi:transmembrane anchor protein [uncultured Roseibium sp.]|uniref:transmembrane anchor protein n=1 Tax=uncultured Roseibium sp. TaxID=1936171 RepID=UPI0032179613
MIRSTVLALIAAVIILVTIVLPAEYGIDPTGIGRTIGLAEMGEIKTELAREAEEDHKAGAVDRRSNFLDGLFGLIIGTAHAQDAWRETVTFTLEPGEYTEIKLVMKEGDTAEYDWVAEGGRINYDLHAHGGGKSIDYEKGRGKTDGKGSFTAPFPGDHGWFWRNRDNADITVTLQLRGDFSDIKQSK